MVACLCACAVRAEKSKTISIEAKGLAFASSRLAPSPTMKRVRLSVRKFKILLMLGVYNCNTYHNFREFCKFWQLDAHNCHESPSSPSFDAASAATEARNAGPRGRSLAGTVLCREFRLTANEGANRPVITVFAPAASCQGGICIWNHQLIEYACHRQPNGATVGDLLNQT